MNLLFSHKAALTIQLLIAIVLLVLSAESSYGEISFKAGTRHQIGLNTIDHDVRDLDGDGNLDIVVVNGGQQNPSPTISILYGTAGGGFQTSEIRPSSIIGHTVAIGDVSRDGLPDIVIASWYQNALAVFTNNGNRQFLPPFVVIPPNPGSQAVGEYFDLAIADFDGDGNNDIVGLEDQTNQRLRFFRWGGQGALPVIATLDQIGSGTSYEGEIAVGDVNSDGRSDIIFANGGPFGPRSFSFVYGQPSGGTLSLTYGFNVEDIAVGIKPVDLDNDGDNDLAVAFYDSTTPTRHYLQVFRNVSGSFVPLSKIWLEYPFPPYDIAVGDLNNDSFQDIAALVGGGEGGTMVHILYGRGDCSLVADKFYVVGASTRIFSGDLDHDNQIDLMTLSTFGLQTDYSEYEGLSNNTANVISNRGEDGFHAPVATLWGPTYIDSGDFNNDGFQDMVSAWQTSFTATSGVDVMINDRAESFVEEVHHPSPKALNGMHSGDFNGDGQEDAISIHEDNERVLALYLGSGSGALATPTRMSFPNGLVSSFVADFNSDNRDDLFIVDDQSKIWVVLGNANGTFSVASGYPMSVGNIAWHGFATGDFNRDGNIDVALQVGSGPNVWLGNGLGGFTQAPNQLPIIVNLVAGDFNGDAKLDLAGMTATGNSADRITAFLGDGNGGFSGTYYRRIPNFSFSDLGGIVAADFDRDGLDDIALTMPDNTFGSLIVVPSDGRNMAWKHPIFVAAGTATRTLIAEDFNSDGMVDLGFLGSNSRGVIYNTSIRPRTPVFDFDGDSKTDLGIYRPNGVSGSEWWLQRSSDGGGFATQFGASTDRVAAADYTGDGKTDIGFWRPSTGFWYVLRSEDQTFYAFPFGASGDVPVPADYDADGKADAGVFRPSDSTWYVQRSGDGGTTIQQFGVSGDVPVNADYDGDGKADIAIYRPSLGQWWLMRSTAGTIAYTFGAPTDKTVVGDYTGDGKADVAFWRPSTGEWFVLRSEDNSFFGFPFGIATDTPVPGDYDGDGRNDAGVFRSSNNTWYIQRSTAGTLIQQFGITGDLPLPNAYVR